MLEDVDGELEMEDVSPTGDAEVFTSKERERLLEERYLEDGRLNPGQPPLGTKSPAFPWKRRGLSAEGSRLCLWVLEAPKP